ncbi:MAG: dTMP kinase [Bdellovibrionales bacterium]|nr:dTMP kinase [Bdellovibrionales bacterium]
MIISEPPLECRSGFLVFEGVNGAGKSTLINEIAPKLERRGLPVVKTLEPGGTVLGLSIRKILLSQNNQKLSERAELLLFAADRAEHVERVIKPNIHNKTALLCDRYYYSTVAFQGYGRNLDLDLIAELNLMSTQSIKPDGVFLLDLDPEVGLARSASRTQATDSDSFEDEHLDFHRRIREGFLSIARECSEPVIVLDASQNVERLSQIVWSFLEPWSEQLLSGNCKAPNE